jgi:hypothetical protein
MIFVAAVLAGLWLRLFFVFETQGTTDVLVWTHHAKGILEHGLFGYYHDDGGFVFNHPPQVSLAIAGLQRASDTTGLSFAALLRAPFALLDLACAGLLVQVWRHDRHRFLIGALYAIHPLACLLSGYHGNTDSAVAFCLVLALVLASRGRFGLAGAVLGLSLWIKLPGLLAFPAFFFAMPGWKARVQLGVASGVVVLAGWAPFLVIDAPILLQKVLGYSGRVVQTLGGVRIWGSQNLLVPLLSGDLPLGLRLEPRQVLAFLVDYNGWIVSLPILLFGLLRRQEKSALGIGATLAGSYAILYGFTNPWSFQYFAWSIPFWLCAGAVFGIGASVVATAYVWGLYAWLCGDPWLRGAWDFSGHPYWPLWLLQLRDVAWLFFVASALLFLGRAVRHEWRRLRSRSAAIPGDLGEGRAVAPADGEPQQAHSSDAGAPLSPRGRGRKAAPRT